MLFKKEHIQMILLRKKTQTRRDWLKAMTKVGGIYMLKAKLFSTETFGHIRVTEMRRERLGDITPSDAMREGGYTVSEYETVWREINGSYDPDLEVFVITFELVDDKG